MRHEFKPTIIWIEHDMQLVRDLADRALVLHYGRQLAIDPPRDVPTDPRVVEAYIGASFLLQRAVEVLAIAH